MRRQPIDTEMHSFGKILEYASNIGLTCKGNLKPNEELVDAK